MNVYNYQLFNNSGDYKLKKLVGVYIHEIIAVHGTPVSITYRLNVRSHVEGMCYDVLST